MTTTAEVTDATGISGPTEPSIAASPRWAWWAAIGSAVVLVGSVTLFLIVRPLGHGVFEYPDFNVYRDAGRRLLNGQPLYTTDPKVLPFTYPPFAAMVSAVFAWFPRKVGGFGWFLANIAMLVVIVRIVFRPALDRLPRPALVAAVLLLTAAMFWVRPINDTMDWGQINVFLLLLVLLDGMGVTRAPRGLLVGVAAAVKLVPAIFVGYFAVTRQWKAVVTSLVSLAVCMLLAAAVAPSSSRQYWTRTLFESNRIGNSRFYSNQSLLGMVERLVPGSAVPYVWGALVVGLLVVGFRRVRRSYDAGDVLAALTITGLLGCLLSPISWFHHFVWILPALGVLIDDGSDRRRVIGAVSVVLAVTTSLPYVGIHLIDAQGIVGALGWVFENSLGLMAVGLVVALPYRTLSVAKVPESDSASPVTTDPALAIA